MGKRVTTYQEDTYFILISIKLRSEQKCSKEELAFFLEYTSLMLHEQEKNLEKATKRNQRLLQIAKILKKFDQEYLIIANDTHEELQLEKEYLFLLKDMILKTREDINETNAIAILNYYSTICTYQSCYIKYYNPNASLFKKLILRKSNIISPKKQERLGFTKEKVLPPQS